MFNALILLAWVALGSLGYVVAHAVLERILYWSTRRAIPEREIPRLLAYCRKRGFPSTVSKRFSIGWLHYPLSKTNGHLRDVHQACLEEVRQMRRYESLLSTAVDVAPALGLLGSVLALVITSNRGADPAIIIGQGMLTTLVGLMIAIPARFLLGVLQKRTNRLEAQGELILNFVQKLLAVQRAESKKRSRGKSRPKHAVEPEIETETKKNRSDSHETVPNGQHKRLGRSDADDRRALA